MSRFTHGQALFPCCAESRGGFGNDSHRQRGLWIACLLVASLANGAISKGFAQNGAPRGFWANKIWIDHLNKKSHEEKKKWTNQAIESLRQSTEEIEEFSDQLSKLEDELKLATNQVTECEKVVKNGESELRMTRQARSDRVNVVLSEPDEGSTYRLAMKRMRDAEEDCAKQSERILERPMIHCTPDKLRSTLKKSEFRKLETDTDCASAFRRYNRAKYEKLEEEKRLIVSDRSIAKLDQMIRAQMEVLKKQKAELGSAKVKFTQTKEVYLNVSNRLADAKVVQGNIQVYLAGVNGK